LDIITFEGITAFIKGIELICWNPLVILEKYNYGLSPLINRVNKTPRTIATIIDVEIT